MTDITNASIPPNTFPAIIPVSSGGGGGTVGGALETTQLLVANHTDLTNTILATPVSYLPLTPVNSTVVDLTGIAVSINSAAEQTIIAAAGAGIRNRVHRVRLYVAAAVVLQVYDGPVADGLLLEEIPFAAAGGLVLDFDSRAYWQTTANKGLVFKTSAAVKVTGRLNYAQAA